MSLNMHTTTQQRLFWMLLAATQLPALRPLAKFLPHPEVLLPLYLIVVGMALWVLLAPPPPLKRVLGTPWPTALLVIAFALIAAFIYPVADALKYHNMGSDADDAIIVAGHAISHLKNPYLFTTYFGNPLSPGPGWVILWAPLSRLGLYPLSTALAIAFTAFTLRRTGYTWQHTNQFLLIVSSCLLMWELSAVGNDLPAWGLLSLSTILLLGQTRLSRLELSSLVLILACLATARIAFTYLPLLVGFSLFAVWPKRAVTVAISGTLATFTLHAAFFVLTPSFYPPLHLIGRGNALLSGLSLYAALAFLAIVGIQLLYHWRWWPPARHAAWGLGAPLFVLAAAELAQTGHFSTWEGATFLIPALPIVLYAILKPNFK